MLKISILLLFCSHPMFGQDAFISIGTHPGAEAQSSIRGKQISTLFPWKGKLYAGYGDYGVNTGPIDIYAFDPDSQIFTFVWEANTEAIYNYRGYNGRVFAPAIDRKSYAKPGDYAMFDTNDIWGDYNFSGSSSTHVFDAALVNDTILYMAGSQDERAAVWESKDHGKTWKTIHYDTAISGDPDDFARYYFAGSYHGKLYVQAIDYYGSLHPYSEVWDGKEWMRENSLFGTSTFAHGWRPDTFANKMIYLSPQYGQPGYSSPFRVFDGVTASILDNMWVIDFMVDSNYLYALVDSGFGTIQVKRTEDLNTWQILAQAPYGCRSMAIMNDRIYLGMDNSQILKYTKTINEINTSVEDQEEIADVILFPNPCLDYIKIILRTESETIAAILDYSGRVVYQQKLNIHANQLDIPFLPPGIYVLKLESDVGIEVKKFYKN